MLYLSFNSQFNIYIMLKIILTTVFLSIACLAINAQSLSIGPMIGANSSSISETDDGERLIGLSAGLFANYSVNEKIGLNIKALFSQMGISDPDSGKSLRMNYVQVPLTGVYFFGQTGDKFRPKVFLGPYVGFLMSAKFDGNDVKENFKSLDYGGQVGLGFNYILKSRTWLNFDVGYTAGFAKVSDLGNTNSKNNAISVNVGVSFPIGN